MTDKEFKNLLDKLSEANERYFDLLSKAEAEIERRHGVSPSDVDCDSWIDCFHMPGGSRATVKKVDEWMEDAKRLSGLS